MPAEWGDPPPKKEKKVVAVPTPNELKELYEEGIAEWVAKEGNPGEVKGHIKRLLDQGRDQILFGLMGFRKSWDKWEVDHCNGREPAVSQMLKSHVKQGLEEWLAEQAGDMPKPPASVLAMIREEYKKELSRTLVKQAKDQAWTDANDILNGLKDELAKIRP